MFVGLFFSTALMWGAQGRTNLGTIKGTVIDPSGAVIVDADAVLVCGDKVWNNRSDGAGEFAFTGLPPATCTVTIRAKGFAEAKITSINTEPSVVKSLRVVVSLATKEENIQVPSTSDGVSIAPDSNASAMVLEGNDLDALADDADTLQNQLQALAGSSAGPSGGQLYIDGFTGGQLPPKSTIKQIRVNQNQFSAEFDKIGTGRIEILTKPGAQKFSGHWMSIGTDSAWNTASPLVSQQPSYYSYLLQGDVSGPISKQLSYFGNVYFSNRQNQSIVNALNPDGANSRIREAVPNPYSTLTTGARLDAQIGSNNTLSVRDSFLRTVQTANGVGGLNLPTQGFDVRDLDNTWQVNDTALLSSRWLNELHFQWRRVRNQQTVTSLLPTIVVEGAFTAGGNNSGNIKDEQDNTEIGDYWTISSGLHTIRAGGRIRSYHDVNHSTEGSNGKYTFESVDHYLSGTPDQYEVTVVNNAVAKITMVDGALFVQDDWRYHSNLSLSYGLRFETQNRIHDRGDWAPRVAIAWAPSSHAKGPPATVLRAGYGWFYDRFTVPSSLGGSSVPYLLQTIRQNGINTQNYVVDDPTFYNPSQGNIPSIIAGLSSTSSVPFTYSLSQEFRSALTMQGAVGIEQQVGKRATATFTYLYSRGVHQYYSDNSTAPTFDPEIYAIVGTLPTLYKYQFRSGAVFAEPQLLATANLRLRKGSVRLSYTHSSAKSDTQGANSFVSVSSDPGLDYGRAGFGIANRLFLIGNYTLPGGIGIAPVLVAQSGTPYNITVGGDLTGNNQFNARPTYGICGAPEVTTTAYGCLDSNPTGKAEKIVSYGVATGPSNVVFNLRLSKSFIISTSAKKVNSKVPAAAAKREGGGNMHDSDGSGTRSRKVSLGFTVGAINLFNMVNYGIPNGVLRSPLFDTYQSLAGGPFTSPTPGNRTVLIQTVLSF